MFGGPQQPTHHVPPREATEELDPRHDNLVSGVGFLRETRMRADQYPPEYLETIKVLARRSAEVVVPILLDLVSPKSVVDFGCATGSWLAVFLQSGVVDVLGIDADWIAKESLEIPRERFLAFDLEKPVNLEREFDLVIALEVGEHLSPNCADTFVESLTKAGPIVLFSAAIPFQGGPHHVNEQWPAYWIDKFAIRGYSVIDCIRRRVWNDQRVAWFYAQNTFLFVRKDVLDKRPFLTRESQRSSELPLSLVHPSKYSQIANPSNGTLSTIFWDWINWLKRRGSRRS